MKYLPKTILIGAIVAGFWFGKLELEWSIGAVIIVMILF